MLLRGYEGPIIVLSAENRRDDFKNLSQALCKPVGGRHIDAFVLGRRETTVLPVQKIVAPAIEFLADLPMRRTEQTFVSDHVQMPTERAIRILCDECVYRCLDVGGR